MNMNIFEKMFGLKQEEIKKPDGELLPPFEDDGSDLADGDELPEALTMEHAFEAVLKKHPELRPEKVEKKEK